MSALGTAAPAQVLSEPIKAKLVEGLFTQPVVLAIGGMVPVVLMTVCFLRTSARWFLFALAVFALVAIARFWINVAFLRAGGERCGRIWRRRFLIGSCASAIVNGMVAARALYESDPFIQMIVISVVVAGVMGAAARNAMYPKAAYLYVILTELWPLLAAVTSPDRYYLCYLPFIFLLVMSSCAIVRYQYGQIVRFLVAEERNLRLVDAVRESNTELAEANAQLEVRGSEKDVALAEQQRYFRTVVANAPVILIALDRFGTIVVAEGRDLDRLGHAAAAMVGASFARLYAGTPELVAQAERALSGDAHAAVACVGDIEIETRWTPRFDETGALTSVIAVATDITNQRAAQRALRYRSLHDPLTQLPNRTALSEQLAVLTGNGDGRVDVLALAFIDLDRFKEINETLGHGVGDALLRSVAQRIERCLRTLGIVGGALRLGGDEFALLLPQHDEHMATAIVRSVLADFAEPHVLGDYRINIGASAGLAMFPDHAGDPQALQRCSDVAMYSAKTSGLGFAVFDAAQDRDSAARLALEADMRQAIANGGFALYYQPQVDIGSGRIASVEALLRWHHPSRGLIAPDEFIPLAEKTGLIVALTHWVLDEALRQVAAWAADGFDLKVAVNISMRGLREAALFDTVAHLLFKHAVPVDRLILEVTESVLVADDVQTLGIFAQLADMGIVLSIDDFGTGYSSLAYLRELPVSELKIDKSFVLGLKAGDTKAGELVRLIVDLAHNLDLRVVAEGVETEEVLDFLRGAGCNIAQGYLMSRPVPADALTPLLARSWRVEPLALRR